MNPQMPELRNTDGDPFEAYTLHFDLDAPEAAANALAELGVGITEPLDAAGRGFRFGDICERAADEDYACGAGHGDAEPSKE